MKPSLRAGSAALIIDPPLGLPMSGVVRRDWTARGRIGHLETSAIVLDCDGTRLVLCGVDTLAIQSPEIDVLRARVAEATGAEVAELEKEDAIELIEGSPRLPLVIARVHPEEPFTGLDIVAELSQRRGWLVYHLQVAAGERGSADLADAREDQPDPRAGRWPCERLPRFDPRSARACRRWKGAAAGPQRARLLIASGCR